MHYLFISACVVLFSFGYMSCLCSCTHDQGEPETPDWRMTLKTIRNGIHKIDTYLNAALDLFGGEDGLCHYKCNDGYKPFPRHNYKPPPPNGCGSPLFGFQESALLHLGDPKGQLCYTSENGRPFCGFVVPSGRGTSFERLDCFREALDRRS